MKEWLMGVALAAVAFIAPIQHILNATLFLVFIDLIFGIVAAKKRKEEITSFKLKRTPIKLLVYLSVLVISFVVQKSMIADAVPIVNMVSTLIGITELKSVSESLDCIYGEAFLKRLIKKVTSFTKKD